VGAVKDLHWRPSGQMLASCGEDGKIMLWNAATGVRTHLLEGHDDWVLSVRWRPDGARLVSCSWDGSLRMWSPTDGKCLAVYMSNHSPATTVRWRPDGQAFACSGVDRTVRVYDAVEDGEDGKVLQLVGHTDSVSNIAWRPDGQCIMSISSDGTARTWNPRTGECIAVMHCRSQCYLTVAWQQNGAMIAAGGKDNTLSVWKPEGAVGASFLPQFCLSLSCGLGRSVDSLADAAAHARGEQRNPRSEPDSSGWPTRSSARYSPSR